MQGVCEGSSSELPGRTPSSGRLPGRDDMALPAFIFGWERMTGNSCKDGVHISRVIPGGGQVFVLAAASAPQAATHRGQWAEQS